MKPSPVPEGSPPSLSDHTNLNVFSKLKSLAKFAEVEPVSTNARYSAMEVAAVSTREAVMARFGNILLSGIDNFDSSAAVVPAAVPAERNPN